MTLKFCTRRETWLHLFLVQPTNKVTALSAQSWMCLTEITEHEGSYLAIDVYISSVSQKIKDGINGHWTAPSTITLCLSCSLFLYPSTPLLSSFTSSLPTALLRSALLCTDNKALMFHSTVPFFTARLYYAFHSKSESTILSGLVSW